MKCLTCYSEDLKEQTVLEEVGAPESREPVEVLALVCQNCGDRYFSPDAVRKLEAARPRREK